MRNSIVWTAGVVFLQNVGGFLIALLLNQRLPFQGALRSLVLLPWVLPGVVAAILWRFMYDPQLGLINSFLIRLGVVDQGVSWLADPSTAMAAVIFAAFWKGFPFSTVVFLAAFRTLTRSRSKPRRSTAQASFAASSTWCSRRSSRWRWSTCC